MPYEERRRNGEQMEGVLVGPGEIALSGDGSPLVGVVSTGLLVCLWNPHGGQAAMAHFVAPATYDAGLATARFGNVALPFAIRMLQEAIGEDDESIEAQVFGGACRDGGHERGIQNLEMARKVLSARSIKLVSEDVGGSKGRKVVFDARSGHAMVIKVHALRAGDWEST